MTFSERLTALETSIENMLNTFLGKLSIWDNRVKVKEDEVDAFLLGAERDIHKEHLIYIDTTAPDGGDGKTLATAFNNPLLALDNLVMGKANKIVLKEGQTIVLGVGLTSANRKIVNLTDGTSVLFFSGSISNRANLHIPYLDHANGNSYSAVIFHSAQNASIAVSGYAVNLKAIASPLQSSTSNYLFLYGGYGASIKFSWQYGDIYVPPLCALISPYVTVNSLEIGIGNSIISGGGDICNPLGNSGLNYINGKSIVSDGNTFITKLKPAGMATNIPTSPLLSRT